MAFQLGSFLGGMGDAMQKNTELQGTLAFRMADLGMRISQYQLEAAKLNHMTNKEQLDYETTNTNAMLGSIKSMLEKTGDLSTANKDQWTALQSGLASQVSKLAGSYTNTHGGPYTTAQQNWEHNFQQLMNVVNNQIMSTGSTTPGNVAINKAFADSLGAVAAHKFNLPQLTGMNAGVQATTQQTTENTLGLPQAKGT